MNEGQNCSDRTVFSSTKNRLVAKTEVKEYLGVWQETGDIFEAETVHDHVAFLLHCGLYVVDVTLQDTNWLVVGYTCNKL